MTEGAETGVSEQASSGSSRLAVLLAMAMFVLVVDTSLMNVSISAVVNDLDTTVSGVQSAIALEALVSAAFILISSKVGDLIGRKRAYVLGLLAYAIGALAMTLAQSLTAIIIFWAIIGGLGASLLLPAMQSLIHGNFEGAARTKTYALVGAAAAIAAAVGPLLGGFVTTYLSWRVGLRARGRRDRGRVVPDQARPRRAVHRAAADRRRRRDPLGARHGRRRARHSRLAGRRRVRRAADRDRRGRARARSPTGSCGASVQGKPTLLDPDLFRFPHFTTGISGQMLQKVTLGGAMIALPIFLQMTLEYNAMKTGLSLAPLSLSMFAVALLAGRKAGNRRPSNIVLVGFALSTVGHGAIIPIVPRTRLRLGARRPAADHRLGARPARLAAEQLHALPDRGGAGQRGSRRQLGRRLVRALVRTGDGRRHHARRPRPSRSRTMVEDSTVIPPAQQQQISNTLEDDAEVMSNTQLEPLARRRAPGRAGRDPPHQHATRRDRSLQVALLVPILASLLGLFNGFRMRRLPDITALGRSRRTAHLG